MPLTDVTPAEAALFLEGIAEQGYAGSSIVQAQAAISWAAQVADREDPTKSRVVTQVVQRARRASKEVVRANPVTLEHIAFLYDWSKRVQTFVSKRTLLLSMCLFLGFARWSDICNLKIGDVLIEDACVTLELHKLKSSAFYSDIQDQHRIRSKPAPL